MNPTPPHRRVWLLTRHYPPDAGALSYRVQHLAEVLSQDHDVTVLASQPNRYEGAPSAPKREHSGSVTIRRISSGQLLRSRGKLGRFVTEFLGALWMALVALRRRSEIDVAYSSMPPFFYALPGLLLKRLAGKQLVLDVRDLWLDWAEETGIVRSRLARRALRRFERSALQAADHITVTTRSFRSLILERFDVAPEHITVVFNGVDDSLAGRSPSARRERNPGDPIHVLYAGNLGPSQNLLGIRDGLVTTLDKWSKLSITVVGDGAQRRDLAAIDHERLHVLAHVDRERLAAMYRDADAFLLHLADLDVYRHTVPSKLFEYAAHDRPILCGVRGEAREIAFRHAACYAFDPDDPVSFAWAADRLCSAAEPDNAGIPRADRSELLRSSRSELWRRVFASVS